MLIVDNLPQQEIYNKQYLVENGCAINLNKKYTISNAIDDINNGKINLDNMVENMKKIAKHDSLKMIIDEVEKIKPAKYTKEMTAKHTKREVIKNIDRARKQTNLNKPKQLIISINLNF